MYQGKFERQNRQGGMAVGTRKAPPAPAKKRKGPRLGGVIFYTLFFLSVLVFYGATYFGLLELRGWLVDYEAAKPTLKCQEVFDQLFAAGKWEELYDAAGIEDTAYESKEAFVTYMENKAAGGMLTYMETSAGLSGDKKYVVRLGDEKIAAFTLVDQNKAEAITDIPDWQLGSIEFFFRRDQQYWIQKTDRHTVYVNGIPLDDSSTVRISTTKADTYLPIGITGSRTCTQQITGLIAKPTVTIQDESGAEMAVSYDEASRTFTEQTQTAVISDAEKETALNAVKTYALFMIGKAGDGELAQYFVRSSDTFDAITASELEYVQDAKSREFANETVTDYCRYSDALFSVRVSLTLNLYRSNGTVKENHIEQSLFFEKQASGKWLCFAMTAVDVSQPVEQVRLTFLNDGTTLSNDFYDTGISQLSCPVVTAPEGKVFAGWMVEETDSGGNSVMRLMFQPGDDGVVTLPSGTVLEPMTLYPLWETEM